MLTGDRAYCTYALMAAARGAGVTLVTDMRLDARLFTPPPPRERGCPGRPARVGARLPAMRALVADDAVAWERFTASDWRGEGARALDYTTGTARWYKPGEPLAEVRWVLTSDPVKAPGDQGYLRLLVATDPAMAPEDVIRHYSARWSCEVTFQEARRHLGVETQRQWSDRAIARTTPCVLALVSVTCLLARDLALDVRPHAAAWYPKTLVTFSDVLAAVRRHLWPVWVTCTSGCEGEVTKSKRPAARLRATSPTPSSERRPERDKVELMHSRAFDRNVRTEVHHPRYGQHSGRLRVL